MLRLDIPITKVDAARRLVTGVATAETADRAGEVCDYESTKPNYERWSRAIADSTQGRSLGNLRAMHGSVAAGKVTAIHFNDVAKQIEICAKVVDDAEWAKVVEGVYTGFSQGGTYARRWTDEQGATRYTADPHEISLVDLPCLPEARFEMVKSDGSREWRDFRRGGAELTGAGARDGAEILKAGAHNSADVHKVGARNSAADQQRIQALHDKAVELGACCPAGRKDEMGKASGDTLDALDTLLAKRLGAFGEGMAASLGATVVAGIGPALARSIETSIEAPLAGLERRLAAIEAQPLPLPLAGTRAVAREGEEALLDDPGALSLLAIKLAQRQRR